MGLQMFDIEFWYHMSMINPCSVCIWGLCVHVYAYTQVIPCSGVGGLVSTFTTLHLDYLDYVFCLFHFLSFSL